MAYGTRSVSAIGGMFGILPRNAVLWVIGILLICGTPPSPLFVTEYLLVRDAPLWLGITVLVLLFAIFAGMAIGCLKMTMGKCEILKTGSFSAKEAEKLWGIPFVGVVTALVSGGLLRSFLNMGRCEMEALFEIENVPRSPFALPCLGMGSSGMSDLASEKGSGCLFCPAGGKEHRLIALLSEDASRNLILLRDGLLSY